MSELEVIISKISSFDEFSHVEKIKIFGWYLQEVEKNNRFTGGDLLRCYDQSGLKRPANISKQMEDMRTKSSPDVLRDKSGYYLERRIKTSLDESLGHRKIALEVNALLLGLPTVALSEAERSFLNETLICYRQGAFRSAIVMSWNLAYSHFCEWILRNHLTAFNAQWPIRLAEHHKRSKVKVIGDFEHFGELKEAEVIEIARSAGLITQGMQRTLQEKLGKRNSAAHPSRMVFAQVQCEECIHDLVSNVILKMP